MKWIASVIEKKPLVVIIGVLLFPLVLAVGMYICIFSFAKGEASAWLGFWGSYLGGLISGIFTFAGVYYAFNLQREENKIKEILKNYADVFTVFSWCEDMIKYLDGTRKWDSEHVAEMTAKARDSYNVFISIDPNWYKRFQGIIASNFQLESIKTETTIANTYVNEVFENVKKRNAYESEFHQAVKEIFDSLVPVFAKHPEYMEHSILEELWNLKELLSSGFHGWMTKVKYKSAAVSVYSLTVL